MSQKSGNHVKPPVNSNNIAQNAQKQNIKDSLTQEHHGESTDSFQDDKRIGQHNQAGRPPLMKK